MINDNKKATFAETNTKYWKSHGLSTCRRYWIGAGTSRLSRAGGSMFRSPYAARTGSMTCRAEKCAEGTHTAKIKSLWWP